jgi:hypothetical protein
MDAAGLLKHPGEPHIKQAPPMAEGCKALASPEVQNSRALPANILRCRGGASVA